MWRGWRVKVGRARGPSPHQRVRNRLAANRRRHIFRAVSEGVEEVSVSYFDALGRRYVSRGVPAAGQVLQIFDDGTELSSTTVATENGCNRVAVASPVAKTTPTTLVRARGLEPPRELPHRDLNPARLPIPPHPRERALSHRETPVDRRFDGLVGRAGIEPATLSLRGSCSAN
jgi:hypothetical protein